jgi:hypothetical protein
MNQTIQHHMNPLHVYCRLRNMGMSKSIAGFLCRRYERTIFKHLLVVKTRSVRPDNHGKGLGVWAKNTSTFLAPCKCELHLRDNSKRNGNDKMFAADKRSLSDITVGSLWDRHLLSGDFACGNNLFVLWTNLVRNRNA